MTPTISWPQRRQATRTTLNSVVYINFDSDNGGIVLNVSEGGLCFHSVAPVQREGTLRFWFSEHKQKIEADAEIAWIDETGKTGGLRFTTLPEEGHEQIRNWISRPATRLAVERPPARSVPPPARPVPRPSPDFTPIPPDIDIALDPLFPAVHLSEESDSPNLPADDSSEIKVASLTGFSRGLATGLLVSALVALPFLLHSYRHELGESLIHLGERLASKSRAQTQTATPAQQAALLPPQPSSTAHRQIPVSPPEKILPRLPIDSPKPQHTKLELSHALPAGHAGHAVTGGVTNKIPASAARESASSAPPAISLPATAAAPASNVPPDRIATTPPGESAKHTDFHAETTGEASAASSSAGYFEVGKFKNSLWANNVADRLGQLGFHAAVVQKGRLWMNSYSVLVGPYGDNQDAEAARKDLVLHGFNPRAFEKGSRDFRFPLALTLNGTPVPNGDYTITWESYSPDAVVKFVRNFDVVATAVGKWMKRDVPYKLNAVVWRASADGSRILLEIRFGGMSRALVFRTSP
ncbi:MAG: PilZ domain-containing protein [Candidatus Acidiferrales bacterium]